jgi:hypothetical protein
MCGHLAEALPLIGTIQKSPAVSACIDRCSKDARSALARLTECLSGGPRSAEFHKYVRNMRNKVAFHYDPKPIRRALAQWASRSGARTSTITLGSSIDLWRFNVADEIEAAVVFRQVWKVPYSADVEAEDDRISLFGSRLCMDFIQFAGEVSTQFVREHAQA